MTNDFNIKQAMETAVSQAESFDQSDYAAGDLVPIFRPNATTGRDELVGKVPKSYFMQAVQASLKDLLRGANLGANIDKVPTLNANNFGSTSIADLASVLGGAWVEPFPQSTPTDGRYTMSELGLGIFSVYHFGIFSDLPPIAKRIAISASGMVIRVLCTSSQVMTFAFIESGELFTRYGDNGTWNAS